MMLRVWSLLAEPLEIDEVAAVAFARKLERPRPLDMMISGSADHVVSNSPVVPISLGRRVDHEVMLGAPLSPVEGLELDNES